MEEFRGKWVFVSGSRRGIGRAIVSAFAHRGANIIAHARKPDDAFQNDMAGEAAKNGVRIRTIYFDMADSGAIRTEIRLLLKEIKPDVLVNNAGKILGGVIFGLCPLKLIREIFEVNLFSQMELTQLLLKPMLVRKSGNIINIASVAALDAHPGIAAYGSSKAALVAWTKILAAEVGAQNIRINAISPGMVETEGALEMGAKSREIMLALSAMQRFALPEEIAKVACFLASSEASFINGEVIRVDGGAT